ncbi:MAG: LPS export ABC transporter periplasmic protein LptC [Candidatus Koribacter versatilis]|uniref:LPS export ABC transporter periplasmic protein LptC n=1 Tax=Candidatus Korobacter versatilis TaxID=658062 RepID=A0A932A9J6_9BACT|nr:LPS export ABC transporter periplasmic protein LptC [Candidatus Koribacter versatilis]
MAFDPRRLRKWFALGAVFLALVVAAFYGYNKIRAWTITQAARSAGKKLGVDVQQSAQGWTISKSEGGRTLFTVRASNAMTYKQGGRAELDEVSIVIYGREANRFDQIYGRKFSYDPGTGEVRAEGEVHIDLESNAAGPVKPDQAPPQELKNPIHVLTSGLVFNRNTGVATTDQRIEFRVPQASGTAKGASYDAKQNLLTIASDIRIKTTGQDPANIQAAHGVITGDVPRQAVLDHVKVERAGGGNFDADKLTVYIRDDNKIDHMVASGNVRLHAEGETPVEARAPQATFQMNEAADTLKTAALTGGVQLESGGKSPMNGTAGRVTVDFAGRNVAQVVHAIGGVRLAQRGTSTSAQATEIAADGMEMRVAEGKYIASAVTQGKAEIVVHGDQGSRRASVSPAPTLSGSGETVITAGKFEAQFGKDNRMRSLHGEPEARIVSKTQGQPERVTTSRELDVTFGSGASGGGISGITQAGDFRYVEGTRTATAQKARYNVADSTIAASGSPRVTDTNLELTANTVRLNRVTGDMAAEGEVKTTYQQTNAQPGAMFSSADPLHATAPAMSAKKSGQARYSGGARLWQGANIVQAPTIDFDREKRTLLAQGGATQPVSTVFVQADKTGRMTPVNVTARKLTYSDQTRQAKFEGGVVMRGADATITAEHAEVFLKARPVAAGLQPAVGAEGQASQLERIVAEGGIEIRQATRRAVGTKLVYTAADGRFVLTGSEGRSPSIFDAEQGTITGDSLTFYSRDDKVVVGSGESSRTVTQTRVKP